MEYASLLGLKTVQVLYRGEWDEQAVRAFKVERLNGDPCEGHVVRVARAFSFREFKDVVGKYVRMNHVQTHGHWMRKAVEVNGLVPQ